MPITNAGQVSRMAAAERRRRCPAWLVERLDDVDDPAEVRRIGVEVATELCAELLDAGAPGPALLHAQPQHGDPGDLRQPRARRSTAAAMTGRR